MKPNDESSAPLTKMGFWFLIIVFTIVVISRIVGLVLGKVGISQDISRAVVVSVQYFLMGMVFLVGGQIWLKPKSKRMRVGLLLICFGFWSQPLHYLALRYLGLNNEIASDFSVGFIWVSNLVIALWMSGQLHGKK